MIGRVAGRVSRVALGLVVSGAALTLLARTADLGGAAEIVRTAAPVWVASALALLIVDVLLRAGRWRVLLAPIRVVRPAPILGYLLVGYLANTVLPLRLGELVRCHYCGDREGISRATTLGTVVV